MNVLCCAMLELQLTTDRCADFIFWAADDSEGEEPAECVGELRLEHVSFRYPARPDVMVMKDFCLDVKAGVDARRHCCW